MKNLKLILALLTPYCFLPAGCKQITKTVDETFHPRTMSIKQEAQKQSANSSYDTITVQHSQQTEQHVTIETHSESYTTDNEGKLITNQAHTSIKTINSNTPQVDPETEKLIKEATATDIKNLPVFWSVKKLQKAEIALRALPQYAGKEIFIYQSALFDENGQIILMLRHPKNPRYVDSYEYREGKWSEPKPEPLSVHADIENRSISLNTFSFACAAKVMQLYNQKAAQVEGAKPTTNAYIAIGDKGISWGPSSINGSRERYSIQFNNDGTLKSFVQE